MQELQNLKRLELLLWESDKIKPVTSHELVGKLISTSRQAIRTSKPVTSHELVGKLISYLQVYDEALSY